VGTLVITNGAVLMIDSNRTLTVNGSWLNSSVPVNGGFYPHTNFLSGLTSAPNSTIILASTNEAIVSGTNAFCNLTCSNAVKIVRFTPGSTNTVAGTLAIGGGVTLQSTDDSSPWYLSLAPGGIQQIGVVKVKNSNAGGGETLIARKGSENLGNNVNWSFPGLSGVLIQIR